jgi:hypothetical protein
MGIAPGVGSWDAAGTSGAGAAATAVAGAGTRTDDVRVCANPGEWDLGDGVLAGTYPD